MIHRVHGLLVTGPILDKSPGLVSSRHSYNLSPSLWLHPSRAAKIVSQLGSKTLCDP
jgi:hypothetical protein